MRTIALLLCTTFLSLHSCKDKTQLPVDTTFSKMDTTSNAALYHSLLSIAEETNSEKLVANADSIYKFAKKRNRIPLVFGDTAVFLYHHSSSEPAVVKVYGDLNGWSDKNAPQVTLLRVGSSNIYQGVYKAPSPLARVDYKLVVNGNWMLDPANPKKQRSGFGDNSELALSQYQYSEWATERTSGNKGTLTANQLIHSDSLGYDVQYKVYLPFGYDVSKKYPLLVTTDGHEYSDKLMGSLTVVADNLLTAQKINPVIIVFVDPRQPTNLGNNRRMTEYVSNRAFAAFLSIELMKDLKSKYNIAAVPEQTAILGTSLGGINSAYVGILFPNVFGLLALQSPAFSYNNSTIGMFSNAPKANLKIYMDTGTIYDTADGARQMKNVMETKNYPLHYAEYAEGHSWGNWRARMDDVLIYFFGK